MRVLLATNTVLFALDEPGRLSQRAVGVLADPQNHRLLSVVTPWELAIKLGVGRWHPERPFPVVLAEQERALVLTDLPITRAHIIRLAQLPLIHRDPFDRMLIAQALTDGLPIVTSDQRFSAYGVEVLW